MSNSLYGPSIADSFRDNSVWKTNEFRKLSNTHLLASVFDYFIGAFVSLLLSLSGPPTVLLRISKVIILPVYSVFIGWAMPHILKKKLIARPPIADSYVHFSILSSNERLIASGPRSHIHPATVSSTSMLTMDCICSTYHLLGLASTRLNLSLSKGESVHRFYYPAFTKTFPDKISVNIFPDLSYYRQVVKFLSSDVFCVWVKRGIAILILAHGYYGLSLSEGHSATTDGLCDFIITRSGGLSI